MPLVYNCVKIEDLDFLTTQRDLFYVVEGIKIVPGLVMMIKYKHLFSEEVFDILSEFMINQSFLYTKGLFDEGDNLSFDKPLPLDLQSARDLCISLEKIISAENKPLSFAVENSIEQEIIILEDFSYHADQCLVSEEISCFDDVSADLRKEEVVFSFCPSASKGEMVFFFCPADLNKNVKPRISFFLRRLLPSNTFEFDRHRSSLLNSRGKLIANLCSRDFGEA